MTGRRGLLFSDEGFSSPESVEDYLQGNEKQKNQQHHAGESSSSAENLHGGTIGGPEEEADEFPDWSLQESSPTSEEEDDEDHEQSLSGASSEVAVGAEFLSRDKTEDGSSLRGDEGRHLAPTPTAGPRVEDGPDRLYQADERPKTTRTNPYYQNSSDVEFSDFRFAPASELERQTQNLDVLGLGGTSTTVSDKHDPGDHELEANTVPLFRIPPLRSKQNQKLGEQGLRFTSENLLQKSGPLSCQDETDGATGPRDTDDDIPHRDRDEDEDEDAVNKASSCLVEQSRKGFLKDEHNEVQVLESNFSRNGQGHEDPEVVDWSRNSNSSPAPGGSSTSRRALRDPPVVMVEREPPRKQQLLEHQQRFNFMFATEERTVRDDPAIGAEVLLYSPAEQDEDFDLLEEEEEEEDSPRSPVGNTLQVKENQNKSSGMFAEENYGLLRNQILGAGTTGASDEGEKNRNASNGELRLKTVLQQEKQDDRTDEDEDEHMLQEDADTEMKPAAVELPDEGDVRYAHAPKQRTVKLVSYIPASHELEQEQTSLLQPMPMKSGLLNNPPIKSDFLTLRRDYTHLTENLRNFVDGSLRVSARMLENETASEENRRRGLHTSTPSGAEAVSSRRPRVRHDEGKVEHRNQLDHSRSSRAAGDAIMSSSVVDSARDRHRFITSSATGAHRRKANAASAFRHPQAIARSRQHAELAASQRQNARDLFLTLVESSSVEVSADVEGDLLSGRVPSIRHGGTNTTTVQPVEVDDTYAAFALSQAVDPAVARLATTLDVNPLAHRGRQQKKPLRISSMPVREVRAGHSLHTEMQMAHEAQALANMQRMREREQMHATTSLEEATAEFYAATEQLADRQRASALLLQKQIEEETDFVAIMTNKTRSRKAAKPHDGDARILFPHENDEDHDGVEDSREAWRHTKLKNMPGSPELSPLQVMSPAGSLSSRSRLQGQDPHLLQSSPRTSRMPPKLQGTGPLGAPRDAELQDTLQEAFVMGRNASRDHERNRNQKSTNPFLAQALAEIAWEEERGKKNKAHHNLFN
ncbi:unnamed protein product [Amoebophrya sp. A120]|nr:unnamed protein product [Amoebophrya sp. A120]|eukprot:GSA120T00004356001.1